MMFLVQILCFVAELSWQVVVEFPPQSRQDRFFLRITVAAYTRLPANGISTWYM